MQAYAKDKHELALILPVDSVGLHDSGAYDSGGNLGMFVDGVSINVVEWD